LVIAYLYRGRRALVKIALKEISIMKNKRILLGVSGGVGAYKACELLRLYIKAGSQVRVIMTSAAREFVTPLSFQALGAEEVSVDMFHEKRDSLEHVSWADWADILVVAPATANIIGKMANGIADDVLSTQAIAYDGPVLIAPAMNVKMYNNSAVKRNLSTLKKSGIHFIGPEVGHLASMITAIGRMVAPEQIFCRTRQILIGGNRLAGRKVIVSAGPTVEPLDPVRYISNRSSGKMGYALADAAVGHGANVILVSGPTGLQTPPGVERIDVETAKEMKSAIVKSCRQADYLFMVAAVADYTPSSYSRQKIHRSRKSVKIDLSSVPDILKGLGRNRPKIVVGFALETENLEARALEKMRDKKIDMIVANNPTEKGIEFGSEFNKVTIFSRGGKKVKVKAMRKFDIAMAIIEESLKLAAGRSRGKR
jgi:phosphopantothenoylcysteine decarboxylase/phosphopantothenate--cysteine ligase